VWKATRTNKFFEVILTSVALLDIWIINKVHVNNSVICLQNSKLHSTYYVCTNYKLGYRFWATI
jgi:hypothetical protein